MTVFDLSRLELRDRSEVERALFVTCRFPWDLLAPGLEAHGKGPIVVFEGRFPDGAGGYRFAWAHPTSSETGGPAIGLDPAVLALGWRRDYLGRLLARRRLRQVSKYRRYRELGFSEQSDAVIDHEAAHMAGFFLVDLDEDLRDAVDALFGGPYEHHEWSAAFLKAYTNLHVPEVSRAKAAELRRILGT